MSTMSKKRKRAQGHTACEVGKGRRKQRQGRTNYAKWLGSYYALRYDELELAIIWVSTRGESLADLPYGRKIAVQDLNQYCETVKAASK